jgi:hypothetical protein
VRTNFEQTLKAIFEGDLLTIYLQDHRAGSTFGVELARRARDANTGTEFGDFLTELAAEIEADRETLLALMERLDVRSNPLKDAVGWTAEKAGRLKLNGRLTSYSPLSRVLELEGLISGVNGKHALWQALRDLADHDSRLDAEQLAGLIERAESQISRLRRHQRAAAAAAFSS